MTATKLRKLGNSLGFIATREVTEHLRVKEGDTVFAIPEPDGTVRLTPYDPTFKRAMQAFERTRRKYRNALRELAD